MFNDDDDVGLKGCGGGVDEEDGLFGGMLSYGGGDWRGRVRSVREFVGRDRVLVWKCELRGLDVVGDGGKGKVEVVGKKVVGGGRGRRMLVEVEVCDEEGWLVGVEVKKLVFWIPGFGKDKGFGGRGLFSKWFEEFCKGAFRHVVDYYRFKRVIGGFDRDLGEDEGVSTVALAEDRILGERVVVKVLRVWNKDLKGWNGKRERRGKVAERAWARHEPGIMMELNALDMMGGLDWGLKNNEKYLCVPRVLDVFLSAEKLYLIMEHISGGNVEELVKRYGPMCEYDTALVMQSILRALQIAHANGIVHRDVKPEQVLVRNAQDFEKGVVLCDWGLARRLSGELDDIRSRNYSNASSSASPTHGPLSFDEEDEAPPDELDAEGNYIGPLCGSVGFLAPEVIQRKCHDVRADIWAAGICFHYMVTGVCPFDKAPDVDTALAIISSLRGMPIFAAREWDNVSRNAMDLCRSMLHADPALRVTAEEALQHPFFNQCDPWFQEEHYRAKTNSVKWKGRID